MFAISALALGLLAAALFGPETPSVATHETAGRGAPPDPPSLRAMTRRTSAERAEEPSRPAGDAPEARLSLSVRDLCDGGGVAGLPFAWPEILPLAAGTGVTSTTGAIALPRDALSRLKVQGGTYELCHASQDEIELTGTIWVHRRVDVIVEVRTEGGGEDSAPEDLAVRLVPLGPPNVGGAAAFAAPDPWNLPWYRAHRLEEFGKPKRVGPGTFRASVPWLRWVGLRATAAGFFEASAEIELTPGTVPPVVVRMELRSSPRLSGVIRDADGRVVANALLGVHVMQVFDRMEDVHVDRLRLKGWSLHGGTCWGKDGPAVMVYSRFVQTDGRGAYSIDVVPRGDVVVTTHAAGLAPDRQTLGALQADRTTDVVLSAPVSANARVALRISGQPLKGGGIALVDITDMRCETSVEVPLDGDGTAPAEWFVIGRDYWILASKAGAQSGIAARGCLRYDGRTTIDVDRLPTALGDFEASVGKPPPPRPH